MSSDQSSAKWAAIFDEEFTKGPSRVYRRVWQSVFGDEYPDEAEPLSYITKSELRRLGQELRVGPGQEFADLGCGAGGPGLWVARDIGAALIGIDISRVAVEQARQRAAAFGLSDRSRFQVGDFLATGLSDESVDGAMSVDALHFVPDKAAAVREVWRILRPGARFALTTWDFNRQPTDRPPQVDDHRPMLEETGFTVEMYEETQDWERRMRSTSEAIIAARDDLVEERGPDAAEEDIDWETRTLEAIADLRRRVMITARKA
jgi:ubiquinone/menaquinone biosynthesis C-methylase UbiE